MFKVISVYFGIELLHLIGLKTSRHFQTIVICSSFDWTMDCSGSFVIGQSNWFGFGFTAVN